MSTHQIPQDYSRVHIREHTLSRNTDQLYDPLRETLLNPQNIQLHAALTPLATRSSAVSKDYKILTPEELQRMQQSILIPDVSLYPTNNIAPIRNQRFIAVDASQRIIGAPVTPQELQRIRSQGFKKQQVLYQLGEPALNPKDQKLNAAVPPRQEPPREQIVYEQQQAERYTVQNFEDYGKHDGDYKYNLFSMVDEPFNKCREFGLGGCTSCPSNEVIASRNRPQSLTWS